MTEYQKFVVRFYRRISGHYVPQKEEFGNVNRAKAFARRMRRTAGMVDVKLYGIKSN